MSLCIFLLYYSYHLCFTCIDFHDLSASGGCCFVVYIRRFIYKFLNVCPFDYTAVAGSGKVGSVNQVNHTSWVAVVTPTDRPKSVRNRCVIELFCGVVLSLCPYDISVGVGDFVIGLSQISSFFSYYRCALLNPISLTWWREHIFNLINQGKKYYKFWNYSPRSSRLHYLPYSKQKSRCQWWIFLCYSYGASIWNGQKHSSGHLWKAGAQGQLFFAYLFLVIAFGLSLLQSAFC